MLTTTVGFLDDEETTQLDVLLIEDDTAGSRLDRRCLRFGSHPRAALHVVHRLMEGLEVLAQRSVDCVLVDLSLPDADGLEALTTLLGQEDCPAVIVLTGADNEIGRRAMSMGAQDFFVKSALSDSTMERAVRSAIERHRYDVELRHAYTQLRVESAQREAAEQALQRGERRLEALFEHVSDVITVIDADGTITSASSAMSRLFGWAESALAVNLFDRIHPEDRDAAASAHTWMLARPGVIHAPFTVRVARCDGSWLVTEIVASNWIHDPAVGGLVLSIRDISKRLEAESALRRSEERYRSIVELASEGVMSFDLNGMITFANRRMAEMFGYSVEELTSSLITDFVVDTPRSLHAKPDPNGPAGDMGNADDFHERSELTFRHREGSEVSTTLATTLLTDTDGNMVGTLAMVSDVTGQRAQDRALLEATRRFEQAFESAPVGIAVIDLGGRVLDSNPAVQQMLGLDPVELESLGLLELVGSRHRDQLADELDALAAGEVGRIHGDYQLRRTDRSTRWVCLDVAVLQSGSTLGHAVCQIEDITSRKTTEEGLSYLGLHDELTGIPNRTLLHDRFTRAMQHRDRCHDSMAVLFLDLDRFKGINDRSGHRAGDTVLIEVSRRLMLATRTADTVGRLGGDEFVVLLDGLADRHEAVSVVERIRDAVAQPITLRDCDVVVTASIGIAFATHNHSLDELLAAADTAMYQAKQLGGNCFEVCADS